MKEIKVQLEVRDFGKGNMDSLKRFLYVNSGTREDNFKVNHMTQDSERTLDMDVCTSSLNVLQEYATDNESSLHIKCTDEEQSSIIEYAIDKGYLNNDLVDYWLK